MARKQHKYKSLIGERFGKLVVTKLSREEKRKRAQGSITIWFYECRCDCGGAVILCRDALMYNIKRQRGTQSCGCVLSDRRRKEGTAFRRLFIDYQNGAKRRGVTWELTEEQFKTLTSSPCHYTGIMPSSQSRAKSGEIYWYNGVDRVDNTIGYLWSNCVPCCADINFMKTDLPYDKFVTLCKAVAERH